MAAPNLGQGVDRGNYRTRSGITPPAVQGGAAGNVFQTFILGESGPAAQTLTPSLYTNTNTFHNPTIAPGTVTLEPLLLDNSNTFFAANVTQGGSTQTITPSLFTNSNSIFDSAISANYSLVANRYDNLQTFFGPSVGSVVTLAPSRYDNLNLFFAATVVRGTVTLSPALLSNNNTFFAATVAPGSVTLAPGRYDNIQTFFVPAVTAGTVVLNVPVVANNQIFYGPVVTDAYPVNPSRYDNQQSFYPAAVTVNQIVSPALYQNSNAFFAPSVELQSFLITRAQALNLYNVYLLQGLETPLIVSPTARTSGAVEQVINESGGNVTISTTSTNTSFNGDIGTIISELAALHGLTANLVVTPSSRSFGSITQDIFTVSGVTTVTRQ